MGIPVFSRVMPPPGWEVVLSVEGVERLLFYGRNVPAAEQDSRPAAEQTGRQNGQTDGLSEKC